MVHVCVCVFSSHSFWTSRSLDVPAGVTQEEGHTGFLIHLLSAVRALNMSFMGVRIGTKEGKGFCLIGLWYIIYR